MELIRQNLPASYNTDLFYISPSAFPPNSFIFGWFDDKQSLPRKKEKWNVETFKTARHPNLQISSLYTRDIVRGTFLEFIILKTFLYISLEKTLMFDFSL